MFVCFQAISAFKMRQNGIQLSGCLMTGEPHGFKNGEDVQKLSSIHFCRKVCRGWRNFRAQTSFTQITYITHDNLNLGFLVLSSNVETFSQLSFLSKENLCGNDQQILLSFKKSQERWSALHESGPRAEEEKHPFLGPRVFTFFSPGLSANSKCAHKERRGHVCN